MKFLVAVIITALLCAIAEYFLPWWMVAVVSFLVALFAGQAPGRAFLMGFCGVGICWLTIVLIRDAGNDHILSARMAELFHLPGYGLFMGVTVLIGGLVGGMAAWSGALLKRQS